MATVDVITLVAVASVVLLVSLPCLRDFAVRENERDARRLLPVLSKLVHRSDQDFADAFGPTARSAPDPASLRAAADPALATLLDRVPRLHSSLPDIRVEPDGRTLRHHGYVFRLGEAGPDGARPVVAWPVDHGRTGLRCFAYAPGLGLLEHANAAGLYSADRGPGSDELDLDSGWAPAD